MIDIGFADLAVADFETCLIMVQLFEICGEYI
jgi:hypothetical protein